MLVIHFRAVSNTLAEMLQILRVLMIQKNWSKRQLVIKRGCKKNGKRIGRVTPKHNWAANLRTVIVARGGKFLCARKYLYT